MPFVLHILTTGARRGAETFAADLIPHLEALGVPQRAACIRPPLDVDISVPTTILDPSGRAGTPAVTRALWAYLSTVPAAVIQAHGGDPLKCSYPVAALKRVPVVYRRIGAASPWLDSAPRRRLYGWLARRAARVVTLSEPARKETIDVLGTDPDRTVVIPNAVDPARCAPTRSRTEVRSELGVPEEARIALFVGALSWEKDPLSAVDILARVLTREPAAVAVVAGEGPLSPGVADRIARLGMDDRIKQVGPRADVADLMGAADLLVSTSVTEAMPGSILEAATAGLPVVAYSVGAIPEVVEHGRTGLLADPGRPEALEGHLLELLSSTSRRAEMGAAAREVAGRFDIGRVARSYLELYEEVAGSRLGR